MVRKFLGSCDKPVSATFSAAIEPGRNRFPVPRIPARLAKPWMMYRRIRKMPRLRLSPPIGGIHSNETQATGSATRLS